MRMAKTDYHRVWMSSAQLPKKELQKCLFFMNPNPVNKYSYQIKEFSYELNFYCLKLCFKMSCHHMFNLK